MKKEGIACFKAETNYFNQRMACGAPVLWSKYTTAMKLALQMARRSFLAENGHSTPHPFTSTVFTCGTQVLKPHFDSPPPTLVRSSEPYFQPNLCESSLIIANDLFLRLFRPPRLVTIIVIAACPIFVKFNARCIDLDF